MIRWRTFTILSILSLVICVAAVVAGALSYISTTAARHGTYRPDASGVLWRFTSFRGAVLVDSITAEPGTLDESDQKLYPPRWAIRFKWVRGAEWSQPGSAWIPYLDTPTTQSGLTYRSGHVPYWLIVLLTGALPIQWFRLRRRLKRRVAAGGCPRCGYDLRATPDRCPECGAVAERATA